MYYDANYLNEHADLKEVYERITGKSLRRRSDQWEGSCPFCAESRDSFRIPDKYPHRWFCRKCKPRGGTAVDLVMNRYDSFSDAIQWLAEFMNVPESDPTAKTYRKQPESEPPKPVPTMPRIPSEEWQKAVKEIVYDARAYLWSESGRREREYLLSRGFTEKTIREYYIGYNPTARMLDAVTDDGQPVKASTGYYIPTFLRLHDDDPKDNVLMRVKVRIEDWKYKSLMKAFDDGRIDRQPSKYWYIKGGEAKSLFCAQYARPRKGRYIPNIIYVEGEFDAMTINQTAGDICKAVTFGSHGYIGKAEQWQSWYRMPDHTVICFDNDSDPITREAVRKDEKKLREEIMKAQSLDDIEFRADAPIIQHLPEQHHDWNDILTHENGAQIIRDKLSEWFRGDPATSA